MLKISNDICFLNFFDLKFNKSIIFNIISKALATITCNR
jgi:hypothetical protein